MPKRYALKLASAVLALCWLTAGAFAQSPAASQPAAVKSEIYFGSDKGAGRIVSQAAWDKFVAEVVIVRFPASLTVVDARGKGTRTAGALTPTRILVVVHQSGGDADARLHEITAEYRKRFGAAGIFHIDQPVQIRAP